MDPLRKPLKCFSGRAKPSQHPFELRSFIELLKAHKVARYFEIGARDGDTFVEVMTSLPVGSVGVAVDLPGGLWGKSSTRASLERAVAHLNSLGYKTSYLFGDSHTEATRRLVLGRGPFDAVLIDGDHTLAGVSRDWESYGTAAPIVAFHDIVGHGQAEKVHGNQVDVPIFWEWLKGQEGYDFREFIEDDSLMGIGVVLRD